MNIELESYLKIAKPKEDHEFLNGESQSIEDYNKLELDIKQCLPDWWKNALLKYTIANLLLEFNSVDKDELAIRFHSFKSIEEKSLNLIPGCFIFELGYIGLGEDATGSEDSFFIKIDEGDNPTVYQISHDISDQSEGIIKHGKKVVAKKLSDIFKHQI